MLLEDARLHHRARHSSTKERHAVAALRELAHHFAGIVLPCATPHTTASTSTLLRRDTSMSDAAPVAGHAGWNSGRAVKSPRSGQLRRRRHEKLQHLERRRIGQ
jgi:hypothetical protein